MYNSLLQYPLTIGNKYCINPLPDDKFQTCKLKGFADDNFKFDKNGRKLSKWVENTVGKGEIAHYEQFLLFILCFQKACFPGASKGVIVWEWVKVNENQYLCTCKTVHIFLLQLQYAESSYNITGIIY